MVIQTLDQPPETVVQRIDAIIRELEELRHQLIVAPKATEVHNLTEELFGAAGHGTWDEYDASLDWKRFSE